MAQPINPKLLADSPILNQSQTNPTGDSRKPAPSKDYASKLSSDVTGLMIGAGRGLIPDTLGAPVDIVRDAMQGMGVPVPDNPVGGSQFFRKLSNQPMTDAPSETIGNLASGYVSPLAGLAKASAAIKTSGIAIGGIFIRPKKADWELAEGMKAKGVTPLETFQTTGVFRGLQGQPRKEISDVYSRLMPEVNTFLKQIGSSSISGKAEQLFKHDKLYADPEIGSYMKDLNIVINKTEDAHMRAVHNANTNTITINAKADATHDDIVATTLHEMQHAIQHLYGMQLGGNQKALLAKLNTDTLVGSQKIVADTLAKQGFQPEQVAELLYWGKAGEVEAREVAKRYGMSIEELKRQIPSFDVWEGMPKEALNTQGTEKFDFGNQTLPNWDRKTWSGN